MNIATYDSETKAKGEQIITVGAFIHQKFDGVEKVFMPKRAMAKKFLPGIYELPGGHVNFGEDIVEGLKREVREENEVDIHVGDSFYVFTYENNIKESHSIEVIYFATFISPLSEIKIHPEDHSEYGWFGENDIDIITASKGEDSPELHGIIRGFQLLKGSTLNFG